jgi:hypothetical protein
MSLEEKLQPGDVVLTCGRGFELGSLPIRTANFFKRGYGDRGWTHAALYIGYGQVVEAFPGGIVKRSFKEAYLTEKLDLLALRPIKANAQAIAKVVAFCKGEESKKYDFRALIYFALFNFLPAGLHFLLDKKFLGDCFNVNDSYFCSELIATGLQKADAYCFENPPYKVMPIDFYNDIWFDVVAKKVKQQSFNWLKDGFFFLLYVIAGILCPLLLVALAAAIFVGLCAFVLAAAKAQKKDEPV